MKKYRALSLLLPVFLTGCLQESPEELDRLGKEDPVFKQMILSRDQAHNQMQLIKQDLLNRKKWMDSQVEKLRADYDAVAKQQNKKIEQFRLSIEQNRDRLKREMEQQSVAMEEKKGTLDGYQKKMAAVRKVLQEGKGFSLSKTERQQWEERALMVSEKIRPLAEEIQELKLQVRLKKQKIQYLR